MKCSHSQNMIGQVILWNFNYISNIFHSLISNKDENETKIKMKFERKKQRRNFGAKKKRSFGAKMHFKEMQQKETYDRESEREEKEQKFRIGKHNFFFTIKYDQLQ